MLYQRNSYKTISDYLETQEIIVLLGSRQVGKTSILELLKKDLKERNKKYLFLDLDLETNLDHFSSYENILSYIEMNGYDVEKDSIYLLLDEFQRAHKAGKILKNIYDHNKNIKIIATGSSSIEIIKTISESMAGRKIVIRIFPLSFRELLAFRNENYLIKQIDSFQAGNKIAGNILKEFQRYMKEMLIYGTYPGVVLEPVLLKKGGKIEDILNSYLSKEIRELLGVKDIVNYKRILELLSVQTSNLLNVNNISKDTGVIFKSAKTNINIMTETYIIDLVRPYFKNRKNEITRAPKLYFEDLGLRNFLIKNMNTDISLRQDIGALVENFVYNEIKKVIDVFTEIKYWRTKNGTEIDFLLIKNQKILPVEVKNGSQENIPRALINFCNFGDIDTAVVVNKDISKIERKDDTTFVFIPVYFVSKVVDLLP